MTRIEGSGGPPPLEPPGNAGPVTGAQGASLTGSSATGGGTPVGDAITRSDEEKAGDVPPAPRPRNPGAPAPAHTGTTNHRLLVLQQAQSDHATLVQTAITHYGNVLVAEADPNVTTDDREIDYRAWVEQFEKELVSTAPKGSDGKPTNPLLNPFFGGIGRTAVSIALYELARVLSSMATRDAAMAILQRQAVRDMISSEVKSILQQGELEAKQYTEMAMTKLISAVVTAGTGIATRAMAYRATRNYVGKTPEETLSHKSTVQRNMQSTSEMILSQPINQGMDAWSNFIQAKYAPQIAEQKANEAFFREYVSAGSAAVQAQWDASSKARDNLYGALNALDQADPEMMKWGNLTRN